MNAAGRVSVSPEEIAANTVSMSTTQTDRQNDGQIHTERQRCNFTMKQFDFIAQFKMMNISTRVSFLFLFF